MDLTLFLIILFIGILVIVIGVILIILSIVLSTKKTGETSFEYGGVLIIGPVPIVFGSKNRAVIIALVLAIVLTILTIFLYILTTGGLVK